MWKRAKSRDEKYVNVIDLTDIYWVKETLYPSCFYRFELGDFDKIFIDVHRNLVKHDEFYYWTGCVYLPVSAEEILKMTRQLGIEDYLLKDTFVVKGEKAFPSWLREKIKEWKFNVLYIQPSL